jgi:hypothetical protein
MPGWGDASALPGLPIRSPADLGSPEARRSPGRGGEGGQGFKLNVTTTNMRKCSMQSCDGRHRQIGSIVSAPDPKTKLAEVRERSTTSGAATYQKYKAAAVRNGRSSKKPQSDQAPDGGQ